MAYGARLESGLGATPREFESPILRREGRAHGPGLRRYRVGSAVWLRDGLPLGHGRTPQVEPGHGSEHQQPAVSAPTGSRSPRKAVARTVAVTGSSSVTIPATAPGGQDDRREQQRRQAERDERGDADPGLRHGGEEGQLVDSRPGGHQPSRTATGRVSRTGRGSRGWA